MVSGFPSIMVRRSQTQKFVGIGRAVLSVRKQNMMLALRLLSPFWSIQNPFSWWTYLLTPYKVNRITPQVTSQVIPDLTKLTARLTFTQAKKANKPWEH